MTVSLHQLLKATVSQNASDLHIVAGSPPALRVNGVMSRVKGEVLTTEMSRKLCYSALTDQQKSEFEERKELDFSFGIKNVARFRANLFYQRGAVSGVFRRIALEVPDIDKLDVPVAVKNLVNHPNGLILVTGPTGSGKSTTIAGLVDKINRERRGHIITLEDPIEYVHSHKNCIVNQREIGADSSSYKDALKYILRQDPDVCVLGELRDLDSVESALTIAETGHLVFATLHTNSASQTINRIVGLFPSDHQSRIRMQLSFVLCGIVSQRLIPSIQGGMISALELLLLTPGIRNLIREDKIHQIYGVMQIGQEKTGMMTLNQSLMQLVLRRKIEIREAFLVSNDPEELDKMMKKAGI